MGLKDLFSRVISGLGRVGPEAPRARGPEDSAGQEEEPIRTRTMAEVLIEQGHLDRAATILRELDEPSARRRLAEVVALGRCDEGVTLAREGDSCGAAWHLDDPAIERARALLGTAGALTLRIVTVHSDGGTVVREQEDRAAQARGSTGFDVPAGARVIASVGVKHGDRFVSVAHASLTPQG